MKVKGQDLIDFFKAWPPGDDVYMEDVPFGERKDGVLCEQEDSLEYGPPVDPVETYAVDYGILGWQGKAEQPANFDDDFVRVLRKWLKARVSTTLVVEVPKEEKDQAIELLKAQGWKVR